MISIKILDRFLKYVHIPTSSRDDSDSTPSDKKEFILADILVNDMKELGISDAYVDEKCYVYGHIPASFGYESSDKIGFIAHMDTSPDFADSPVRENVIYNYDGCDVVLGNSGKILAVKNFPHLKNLKGKTLVTTDGNTLLGADDKSGIAEIMHAVQRLRDENIPHGAISICFTPDEEIGRSADFFDIEAFDADYAYTVDGGEVGTVEYETFNASEGRHSGAYRGTGRIFPSM